MICHPDAFRSLDFHKESGLHVFLSPERIYHAGTEANFFSKIDIRLFFLSRLQHILHRLLNNYLNGEDISASRWHYLNSHIVSFQVNRNLLEECSCCLESLEKLKMIDEPADMRNCLQALSRRGGYLEYLPELLSQVYMLLDTQLPANGTIARTVSAASRFDPLNYHADIREALSGLKRWFAREPKDYFRQIYLVGSLATMDYIPGLSDLDTVLVVKKDTFRKPKTLRNARRAVLDSLKYFYWVDPLQHHGHLILSEIDLKWYPESFFPLSLLSDAIPMDDFQTKLTGRIRDCRYELVREGIIAVSALNRASGSYVEWRNPYYLKFHLQAIQFLPVILNQMTGNFSWKPKAYNVMKSQFSENAWHIIDGSTRMRVAGGYDPIPWKTVFRSLVSGNNPRTLHRRAFRLGRTKPYMNLVKTCIGYPDVLKRCTRLFSEESFFWIAEKCRTSW